LRNSKNRRRKKEEERNARNRDKGEGIKRREKSDSYSAAAGGGLTNRGEVAQNRKEKRACAFVGRTFERNRKECSKGMEECQTRLEKEARLKETLMKIILTEGKSQTNRAQQEKGP